MYYYINKAFNVDNFSASTIVSGNLVLRVSGSIRTKRPAKSPDAAKIRSGKDGQVDT